MSLAPAVRDELPGQVDGFLDGDQRLGVSAPLRQRRATQPTSKEKDGLEGLRPGEVGPGRPAGVSTGGFPRAASRTRRARFRATGAPQVPLWVVVGPTVQLGLNLPYSSLRPKQRELRFVGIHRRQPPGISASSLPTCWPPSPCARLSRARTTTGPPPHPAAIGRQRTCPPAGLAARWGGRPGMVPTFTMESIDEGGARLDPDSIATPTPQFFAVASPPDRQTGYGVDPPRRADTQRRGSCAAHRPLSVRFEPALDLRGFRQRFLSYAFSSCLPDPDRLTVPTRPVRCQGCSHHRVRSHVLVAPSFTGQLRLTGGGVLTPPLDSRRLVAHCRVPVPGYCRLSGGFRLRVCHAHGQIADWVSAGSRTQRPDDEPAQDVRAA